MPLHLRRIAALFLGVFMVAGVLNVASTSASAAPNHDRIVSAVPPAWTPAVNDGSVESIVQTGSTMVAIGDFTNITPSGGSAVSRDGAFAFNATTGALVAGFNPTFNGDVNDVSRARPRHRVRGRPVHPAQRRYYRPPVALLNVSTGALVAGFRAPRPTARSTPWRRPATACCWAATSRSRATSAHNGLASVNATTGALDAYMDVNVAGHHNDTGSGAQGAVGVREHGRTADGAKLVASATSRRSTVWPRDQLVVIRLDSGSDAYVDPTWRTRRYEPYCFNWAFDTYMRGVAVSPDGTYFVVAATGGHNADTLCDTAARFEISAHRRRHPADLGRLRRR